MSSATSVFPYILSVPPYVRCPTSPSDDMYPNSPFRCQDSEVPLCIRCPIRPSLCQVSQQSLFLCQMSHQFLSMPGDPPVPLMTCILTVHFHDRTQESHQFHSVLGVPSGPLLPGVPAVPFSCPISCFQCQVTHQSLL